MISSTKDILYITLAASVGLLTIFLCWGLYYLLTTLKELHSIVKTIKGKFDSVIDFITHLKSKADTTAAAATAVSKAAIEVVKYVNKTRSKKK